MVRKNRLLYDIQDIEGVACCCAGCKQEILYRLDSTIRLPQSCPLCNADWYDAMKREIPEVVLLNTLRYLW